MLRELLSAIQAQPDAVKRWIIADLHGRASDQPGDAEDPASPRSPGETRPDSEFEEKTRRLTCSRSETPYQRDIRPSSRDADRGQLRRVSVPDRSAALWKSSCSCPNSR